MNYSGKKKYVLGQWKKLLGASMGDFLQWAVLTITVVGSLIAFLPSESAAWLKAAIPYFISSYTFLFILLILLLMGLALLVNWPHTRAAYKDKQTDIQVVVECCDILQQEGMKVIHTVDTFDMELDRIISPRSLHGAFLQLCNRNHVDVDGQIDAALERKKPVGVNEELPGRKQQYPLGTICRVNVGDEPFCCVAFTRLQPDGAIQISVDEYIDCLKNMWRNLADPRNRSDVVNVAVMGNKFTDLPSEFSTEQKIDFMIQTFFAVARERACCRTLRICVHPDNAPDIDFDKYPVIIEHLAKRPVI